MMKMPGDETRDKESCKTERRELLSARNRGTAKGLHKSG